MSKIVDKFVLYKMRDILIKEMGRGYYQNSANVKEFIDLEGNGQFTSINGVKCYHINSICIYQNDMFKINDLYFRVIGGVSVLEPRDRSRLKSRKRIKKDINFCVLN